MATVANGGSRRFQFVKPPPRRFETGQYGAKFRADKKPPPKITTTLSERAREAMSQRLSAGALYHGVRVDSGSYIPAGGEVQPLDYVSEEFLSDLTPRARMSLMNVPTKVDKPPWWYTQIPGRALAGLLSGKGLNAGLPAASHSIMGDIAINPEMMEPGQEQSPETLMQHELIHAWDANQMAAMRRQGESLTGLPGILDYPRQFLMRGPGAEAMAGIDIDEDLQGMMKGNYGGWLSAPEQYTMMSQVMGFDPAKIPEEYQHLYSGLFNQESFVRPPPPEPLSIDELRLREKMGLSWEEYYERREELRALLEPLPSRAARGRANDRGELTDK